MPNLDFYSAQEDHEAVLLHVLECGAFRVFEAYSKPDSEIVEIKTLAHLKEHYGLASWDGAGPIHLQLLASAADGFPTFCRINLNPGAMGAATFRYSCEGWGLIQLILEAPRDGHLRNSHTNHFTAKGAAKWAEVGADGRQPLSAWNWDEVQNASRRLNASIRRIAVEKLGSRPVLPIAQKLRSNGLKFLPYPG